MLKTVKNESAEKLKTVQNESAEMLKLLKTKAPKRRGLVGPCLMNIGFVEVVYIDRVPYFH